MQLTRFRNPVRETLSEEAFLRRLYEQEDRRLEKLLDDELLAIGVSRRRLRLMREGSAGKHGRRHGSLDAAGRIG